MPQEQGGPSQPEHKQAPGQEDPFEPPGQCPFAPLLEPLVDGLVIKGVFVSFQRGQVPVNGMDEEGVPACGHGKVELSRGKDHG